MLPTAKTDDALSIHTARSSRVVPDVMAVHDVPSKRAITPLVPTAISAFWLIPCTAMNCVPNAAPVVLTVQDTPFHR